MKMNIKIEVLKLFLFEFNWGYDKPAKPEPPKAVEEPKKTDLLEILKDKEK